MPFQVCPCDMTSYTILCYAGAIILVGMGNAAGIAVRLRRPGSMSLLAPNVSAALDAVSGAVGASEVTLGPAHYLGAVSGLLYLVGGIIAGVASLVKSTLSEPGASRARPHSVQCHLTRMPLGAEQEASSRDNGFSVTMWNSVSSPHHTPRRKAVPGIFGFFISHNRE